jgi:hypothetical protein
MLIIIKIYYEETYRVLKQNTDALSLSGKENALDKIQRKLSTWSYYCKWQIFGTQEHTMT